MMFAIMKEIKDRRKYLSNNKLSSIYFGGGTPSILNEKEINLLMDTIQKNYIIDNNTEITFECNPDDLNLKKLSVLKKSGINRLSIGVQSFKNEDLKLMNRAHNSDQSIHSIKYAQDSGFSNISIDLIFSLPNQLLRDWESNLETAFNLDIQHISSYCLTIEERTKFSDQIKKGKIKELDEKDSLQQFQKLINETKIHDFIQYEISNFSKEGFFSKHNISYWTSKEYIGIGPSAHSYNSISRQWNFSNNVKYISSVLKESIHYEIEYLNKKEIINEYIITSLRTMWGLNLDYLKSLFKNIHYNEFMNVAKKWTNSSHMIKKGNLLLLTDKGKFISNRILSSLLLID